jgi:hypothetical protein
MSWKVIRLVNEEGCSDLGPFRTRHMAELRADQDRARLARVGYDLVWYDFVEITNGTDRCIEIVSHRDISTSMG